MRDSKLSDNILPNKLFVIHIPDIFQWFRFNPLGEVIRANQYISFIPCCLIEKPYNILPPLSERPGTGQGIEDPSRLVNVWGKFLTLVTLFHIVLCFFLHIRPPIALCKGPVWLPQISSCNSSKSSSTASGCIHSRYGSEKDLLYNFWSSNNQN